MWRPRPQREPAGPCQVRAPRCSPRTPQRRTGLPPGHVWEGEREEVGCSAGPHWGSAPRPTGVGRGAPFPEAPLWSLRKAAARDQVKLGAGRGWDVGGVGVRDASLWGSGRPRPGPRATHSTLGQALGAAWFCTHHVSSLPRIWGHGVLWRPLSARGAPSPSRPRRGEGPESSCGRAVPAWSSCSPHRVHPGAPWPCRDPGSDPGLPLGAWPAWSGPGRAWERPGAGFLQTCCGLGLPQVRKSEPRQRPRLRPSQEVQGCRE